MGTNEAEIEAIENLYKKFYILSDAKETILEHEKEFLEILAAVKGFPKEKILASQFITRFFKHFPQYAHDAIECLLDLCEDDEEAIRKQAIKDLPLVCKENKQYTQKMADILGQLLQTEHPAELAIVNASLLTLLKLDSKACLSGLYSQIVQGDDVVREKCLRFINTKVKAAGKDIVNKEAEEVIINESKKVLQDVNALEFNLLMEILGGTRLGLTVSGHEELVKLVAEQAEINQPFVPGPGDESELLDRLINCVRHALPYFSIMIPSTKFVTYVIDEVLNQIDKLLPVNEEEAVELELLKVLAELTTHCGALENPEANLQVVFNRLKKYLPLPPMETEEAAEQPHLKFSHVECLMYAFHRLLKQKPEFLEDPDVLKDFRLRLQYFARGIQGYIKTLKEALAGKTQEQLNNDENKLKAMALRTTDNINTLIKDLFHTPPSCKASVVLSWKAKQTTATKRPAESEALTGNKRHPPIIFSGGKSGGDVKSGDGTKRSRQLYQPPGGKFSHNISSPGPRGRGGFRGRGRFRGGRNRNRY